MKKILCIDDDEIVLGAAQAMLEEKYQVITLTDSRKAMQMVIDESPSLIMLDILMPHLSGTDLISILANDQRTEDVPIVISSSDTTKYIDKLLSFRSVVGIAPKPYHPERLLNTVRDAIELGETQRLTKSLLS